MSLFKQCPTWKKDQLSRLTCLGRHTFYILSSWNDLSGRPYILRCGSFFLVKMSLMVDHWHPWPYAWQGHCLLETSVKIRKTVCRLNIQVHVYGKRVIYEFIFVLLFIKHCKTFINKTFKLPIVPRKYRVFFYDCSLTKRNLHSGVTFHII